MGKLSREDRAVGRSLLQRMPIAWEQYLKLEIKRGLMRQRRGLGRTRVIEMRDGEGPEFKESDVPVLYDPASFTSILSRVVSSSYVFMS